MNRWVMFGFILAFLMLPTITFSVKSNYLDEAESNERPILLLLTAQEASADVNTTSPTSTATFLPSNSSTPTATPPEPKTIPAGQIIALSASVIVAAVCLWICFKKPSPTKTQYYQPKTIHKNTHFSKTKRPSKTKSATPTQKYTTNLSSSPKNQKLSFLPSALEASGFGANVALVGVAVLITFY